MTTETTKAPDSSIQPVLQRAKKLQEGEMSLFVTPAELGGSPSRDVIEGLRKSMKELGFHLVLTHGRCYEFSRGGKLAYYRDMVRYILGWSTGRGI